MIYVVGSVSGSSPSVVVRDLRSVQSVTEIGAIYALCFDTPIELRPGSTTGITDGEEPK